MEQHDFKKVLKQTCIDTYWFVKLFIKMLLSTVIIFSPILFIIPICYNYGLNAWGFVIVIIIYILYYFGITLSSKLGIISPFWINIKEVLHL